MGTVERYVVMFIAAAAIWWSIAISFTMMEFKVEFGASYWFGFIFATVWGWVYQGLKP